MAPRRPLLKGLGIVLILFGLVALGPAIAGARTKTPGVGADVQWVVGGAFVFALVVLPVGLGVVLVLIGDRDLPSRWAAGIRSWPARLRRRLEPAALQRALASPFGLLALAWLVGILPVLAGGEAGALVSALGLTAMGVAQPMISAFFDRWWLHSAIGIVGWAALFMTLGGLPQVVALRESAMVYLLPFMVYPAALGVSGLLRLVLWLRACRPAG
jgi:hypothetical protein